jgi:hypothetical protein
MMHTIKIVFASYIGILSLLFLLFIIPSSSVFNSLVLAQPAMRSSGSSTSGLGSNSNGMMDFGFMNFTNNILNASSLFGTMGMSMVDGVKVTGVNIL